MRTRHRIDELDADTDAAAEPDEHAVDAVPDQDRAAREDDRPSGHDGSRRQLLRGAAGLLVGAFVVDRAAGEMQERPATLSAPFGRLTQTLTSDDLTARMADAPFGSVPGYGDEFTTSGTLSVDGVEVGEVHATSTSLVRPGRGAQWRTAAVTRHILHLADGALVVEGPTTHTADPDELAVTGGTGRYAGATGTVRIDLRPAGLAGDGSGTYDLDITLTEAR